MIQSKLSLSLLKSSQLTLVGVWISGGPGAVGCARFCRFKRYALASSSAFWRHLKVSIVATIVSPHKMACFPDCRFFRAETISCNSNNCFEIMRVLVRLRSSVWVNRTTCWRTDVSNAIFRFNAHSLIWILVARRGALSIGEEVRSGCCRGDSNCGVVSHEVEMSVGGGIGTRWRTVGGQKGFKPVPDHPLNILLSVKALLRAGINASIHSAFCIWEIPVRINQSSSHVMCFLRALNIPISSGWVKYEVCGGSKARWTWFARQCARMSGVVWLPCPSKISKRGRPSALARVFGLKFWVIHFLQYSLLVQPWVLTEYIHPFSGLVGSHARESVLPLKITSGGSALPSIEIHSMTETHSYRPSWAEFRERWVLSITTRVAWILPIENPVSCIL